MASALSRLRGWCARLDSSEYVCLFELHGSSAVGALCKRLSVVAVKSSYIIWLNRFNRDFRPFRLRDGAARGVAGGDGTLDSQRDFCNLL